MSAFEIRAGASRVASVELPEGAPEPGPELRGAVSFLLFGLDGSSASGLARAIARLVALEACAEGSVRARVTLGAHDVGEAEARCGAPAGIEESSFGRVDVVDEEDAFGVYRLRIAPGLAIPTHEHRRMDEWEYALSGDLALQGEAFPLGDAVRWPARFPHRWENRGQGEAAVLCIDRPRFEAADEVQVDAATLEKCPLRFRPRFDPPSL